MIHNLKIWPEAFNQVLGGLKAFELRKDDRGYEEGDLLHLCEYEPFSRAFTGREVTRRVTCITRSAGPAPLPDGLVVLGMVSVSEVSESREYLDVVTLEQGGSDLLFIMEHFPVASLPTMDPDRLRQLFTGTRQAFEAIHKKLLVLERGPNVSAEQGLREVHEVLRKSAPTLILESCHGMTLAGVVDRLLEEQTRLAALLHAAAEILGVPKAFGAVEEDALLTAAKRLKVKAGEDPRLGMVLELIREAHGSWLLGSAPKAKECTGEAARLLSALIDGRE
jgi:hypothetical protein